jgi:hypothetical protein
MISFIAHFSLCFVFLRYVLDFAMITGDVSWKLMKYLCDRLESFEDVGDLLQQSSRGRGPPWGIILAWGRGGRKRSPPVLTGMGAGNYSPRGDEDGELFPDGEFPVAIPNYYRRFIPDFSRIAKPMTELLKKGVKFVWSEACEKSFHTLRQHLTSALVLVQPDNSKPFEVFCDASGMGLGCVIMQEG